LQLRMHVLRRLREREARQCLSELRWRICPAADPAHPGMAGGPVGGEAPAVGQTRAPLIQSRRYRGAFEADSGYSAGAAVKPSLPSMRANGSRECAPDDRLCEAIQKSINKWIASSLTLLAMITPSPAESSLRPRQSRHGNRRPGTSRASQANRRLPEKFW
jgi:hypothetical protein